MTNEKELTTLRKKLVPTTFTINVVSNKNKSLFNNLDEYYSKVKKNIGQKDENNV